jgi:hypothetical protein
LMCVRNGSGRGDEDRKRNQKQSQSFDPKRPVRPISVDGGDEAQGHGGRAMATSSC